MIHTGTPFDSVVFWMAGSRSTGGSPSFGGWLRSGDGADAGAGACAAIETEAATTSSASQGRRRRGATRVMGLMSLSPHLAGTTVSSTRRSAGRKRATADWMSLGDSA